MLTIARKRASNNLVQERAKANRFANKLTIFFKKKWEPMKSLITLNTMIWLDDEINLIALTKMQIVNSVQVWEWKHMHFWNLQIKYCTVIYADKKKTEN